MRWLRRRYGAGPLHLALLAASFAIAGAAFVRFFDPGSNGANIVIWFVGAIVFHDLVLFPLYSLVDLIAGRTLSHSRLHPPVSPRNHLRVPAALSAMLLLVYFPLILQLGSSTYHAASGMSTRGYLARWLLLTGGLFACSAVAYAVRIRRAARRRRID